MSSLEEAVRVNAPSDAPDAIREPQDVDVVATLKELKQAPKAKAAPKVAAPPEDEPQPEPEVAKPEPEGKRAKKQEASAEDVPRIRELTAKWRAEEAKNAEMAKRLADLEARVPKPAEAPAMPENFRPEPQLAEFDTYEGWMKAQTRWQIDAAMAVTKAEEAKTKQAHQVENDWKTVRGEYDKRVEAFAKETPDFAEAFKDADAPTTPLMDMAILTAENGPAIAYHLVKHPDFVYELNLITAGHAVTPDNVAYLQRLVTARMAAAPPGSASTPRTSRANPPIKPAGGSPMLPTTELADMSVEQMADRWRKHKRFTTG